MDLVEDGGQDHHHLGNAWVVHRVVLVADRAPARFDIPGHTIGSLQGRHQPFNVVFYFIAHDSSMPIRLPV